MISIKYLLLMAFVINSTISAVPTSSAPRRFMDIMSFGYNSIVCNGCPQRYCDDDPAIIYGYCCGCASIFEVLPITCYGTIQCPLDKTGLCHDYNYMRRCCC